MVNRPGSAAGGDELAGAAAVWAEAIPAPKRSSMRPATIAFLTVFLHVDGRTATASSLRGIYTRRGANVTLFVVSTAVARRPRRPSTSTRAAPGPLPQAGRLPSAEVRADPGADAGPFGRMLDVDAGRVEHGLDGGRRDVIEWNRLGEGHAGALVPALQQARAVVRRPSARSRRRPHPSAGSSGYRAGPPPASAAATPATSSRSRRRRRPPER